MLKRWWFHLRYGRIIKVGKLTVTDEPRQASFTAKKRRSR